MSLSHGEYTQKLDGFLAQKELADQTSPVDIYHAVRNIPYGSRGGRSPELVLANNEGSCSGKHILLRDLLRHVDHEATIETVQGDFAAGVPMVETMPDELQGFCKNGGVRDFHQYVVWKSPKGECKLDATWPDFLVNLGFSNNAEWAGEGDTQLALTPDLVLDRVEDLPGYKKLLLDGLTNDEQSGRLRFLNLLSDWIAKVEKKRGHK